MSDQVLAAHDVAKSYRTSSGVVHALRGVSLRVSAGETLAIVGESGCGKSTLGRLLVGLEKPDRGSVEHDTATGKTAVIPMVFQDSLGSLHPRRKVEQLIVEPILIRDGAWRMTDVYRMRAQGLAKAVGLGEEHLGRYPHELSGGQRQRVNIARALALDPDILLLDEPVSALDVSIQAQILNLLLDLQRSRKLALVFISHDLSVVRHIAHDVAVLYLGEVVEFGRANEILHTPKHPYTQALVASDPAAQEGPPKSILAGEPPSPFLEAVGCAFAGRCPWVESECRVKKPVLTGARGRSVACHPALRELERGDGVPASLS